MPARRVNNYVDAGVRDGSRDASAMHSQFGIDGNSAANARRIFPCGTSCERLREDIIMKRLRMVLACLVCLGMAAASGSVVASGDMNQSDSGASSTSTNSSGGGY